MDLFADFNGLPDDNARTEFYQHDANWAWRDGIHSYLTYLRDRLTVAQDLLTESGSVFVQIGDENVQRVRTVVDEVFGEDNYVVTLKFSKTAGLGGSHLDETFDYIVWYARAKSGMKFRRPFLKRTPGGAGATQYRYVMEDGRAREVHDLRKIDDETRLFLHDNGARTEEGWLEVKQAGD